MFALISRILNLSGRYKSRIQAAFLCAFVESILSKMPIFMAFIVLAGFADNTLTGKTCLFVGLGLLAVVVVQTVVHYLSDRLQSAAGFMIFADKRMELGNHLRKMPMGYFTSGNIGKISSVLSTDMVFIEEVAMSTLGNMMGYLLSSLILLVFMFYLNVQLGLIAAAVTVLAWLVSKGMNKVSLREAAERQEQSERLTDAVLSFVEGIGVIKSYNLLGEKSEELTDNFQRSRNTSLAFEQKMTPWTMSLNILYGIGIAAIFGLSIVLEQRGALPLAYVLGVLLFVFDLFGPLKALYGEASRLTVMNAALDRIEAVLNEPELPDTGKQHLPAQAQPGQPEVQFNDVVFAYQDKEVLHHISFAMKKDSMTALVGPSGSGKSTIANLLARLWDVKSGSIIIRGMDIRNVPLAELMEQISMVFQRVYLFQDTIYNNISIGKPDATEEEVYAAAKKARCYDFIMALPDGFQTVVGEGGATLSGGEKQRISIARCILKDAPIIILDEATASVDTDNESYIQEAISELVKGKTLLVIAHRLNTIQNADQILVIDNGQIAQQGTHEELLKQPGIYQEFVNIRKNAAGWSLA
ncbi:ATP-binding cassette domain-containing protein [Faecalibacterium sp. BIOML-A3]|uniref:ABC transporter ATP-binding protein n=1 Tax=unclassified Faecalibacterium TaxID=2646395 RepID=UPI0012AF780A|nr:MULTISPECIES: ABC transporter ATP-binding protein [unclassified Faecalibacterium]MSD28270.1 ATP-binding cassette domain-containing protein [Faecalibacterium sp. BIOML-A4]MSD46675.1 ATP-binding cassette domain-containing protein [Faecalibacterium sp. BIOML-A3]